jgi:hypothetical protein
VFPPTAQARAGGIPKYRTSGPSIVVCKSDSRARIRRAFRGRGPKTTRLRNRRLATLKRCRFHDIQPAINAAKSGYRILLMPGIYKERASRRIPVGSYGSGPCAKDYVETESLANVLPPPAGPPSNDPPVRPDRNFLLGCPNAKYLVLVNGDPRREPTPMAPTNKPMCLQLCNLQIEGLGRRPEDVVISGDRRKVDVLRVDRANGIYLRNFTVENGWFNNVDVVEVDGFRISHIVARYGQDYGILTFTAVNGLYDHDVAYGNGDSGLYPGSTMKGCDVPDPNTYFTCEATGKPNFEGLPGRVGCQRYSIEIRDSESYGNTQGYSGTAGNSTWIHDTKFHHNAAGLSTDSFVPGHPGFPQECFKWENNEIYSNNVNVFSAERQQFCTEHPFETRDPKIVCPQFAVPVGTGVFMGGANRNLLRDNFIYDNWRQGVGLVGIPAILRSEYDPARQQDTSNGNQFIGNHMGRTRDGRAMPNGIDFGWDGQGVGNCWQGNAASGRPNDPASLPGCPGGSTSPLPTNPTYLVAQLPCTAWDPEKQHNPPGCDWFMTPAKP